MTSKYLKSSKLTTYFYTHGKIPTIVQGNQSIVFTDVNKFVLESCLQM